MAQLARERGFVLEEAQLAPCVFRILGELLEHLDCDLALAEGVDGKIDRAGRALAEQLLHFVFADARKHSGRGNIASEAIVQVEDSLAPAIERV